MPATWFPTPIRNYISKEFLTLSRILEIGNVGTVPVPTNVVSVSFLHRVEERLHPFVISGVWLHEVNYVESVILILPCILHLKVVPLSKAACPVIILQIKIVFEFPDLHCPLQIATFEATLKYQCFIRAISCLEFVVGFQLLVVTV